MCQNITCSNIFVGIYHETYTLHPIFRKESMTIATFTPCYSKAYCVDDVKNKKKTTFIEHTY